MKRGKKQKKITKGANGRNPAEKEWKLAIFDAEKDDQSELLEIELLFSFELALHDLIMNIKQTVPFILTKLTK